jgi:hypothetical protein
LQKNKPPVLRTIREEDGEILAFKKKQNVVFKECCQMCGITSRGTKESVCAPTLPHKTDLEKVSCCTR